MKPNFKKPNMNCNTLNWSARTMAQQQNEIAVGCEQQHKSGKSAKPILSDDQQNESDKKIGL